MNYKAQIEAVLLNKDWEVMMIDLNKGCIENWKVQFKFNPNIYFYLYFLIDQMHEEIVDEIKAVTELLNYVYDDKGIIATLCMRKGTFNKKLIKFIDEIEKFKLIKIQEITDSKKQSKNL